MSFEKGFEAIEEITNSSDKLLSYVNKVEALEARLSKSVDLISRLESALQSADNAFSGAENATLALKKSSEDIEALAQSLPDHAEAAIFRSEERISKHIDQMTKVLSSLPELLESAVAKKLDGKFEELEVRVSNSLREELKDTRAALRDAMEVNARNQVSHLEAMSENLISEMPRGLFGRPKKRD